MPGTGESKAGWGQMGRWSWDMGQEVSTGGLWEPGKAPDPQALTASKPQICTRPWGPKTHRK